MNVFSIDVNLKHAEKAIAYCRDYLMEEKRPVPIPLISIVGRSGSGKTSLMERIIPEIRKRGYKVGTIKHHAHVGFEIDYPGKDTWRHAQAGSEHVVIASPGKIATIRITENEPSLPEIVLGMTDVDIILTEGYHWGTQPKLEVVRSSRSTEPLLAPDALIGIVSDISFDLGLPCFPLEDTPRIVDFLESSFLKQEDTYAGV